MAIKLRILRFATAADAAQFTGLSGQLALVLETKQVFVHDGVTAGGVLVGLSEAAVNALISDALAGLEIGSIEGLQAALDAKASSEDLTALETALQTAIDGKIDEAAAQALVDAAVSGLATAEAVAALETSVAAKADKTFVDTELAKKVAAADLFSEGTTIIKAENLPSYVDDVMEFDTFEDFPAEGERDKIYVNIAENSIYRWSGTQYINLASPEVLDIATDEEVVAMEETGKAVSPAGLAALVAELGFVQDGEDWVLDEGEVGGAV